MACLRPFAVLFVTATLVAPTAALAAAPEPAPREPALASAPASPWLAAGLSTLAFPVVFGASAALAGTVPGGGGLPFLGVSALSPLLVGSGQYYAGDWQRGLWFGAGAYGVGLGSMLLATSTMRPGESSAGVGVAFVAVGGLVIWSAVSGVDAYFTARRMNDEKGRLPAAPR